jgi:hypothetical protein
VVDDTLTPELESAINLVLEGKGYLLDDAGTALLGDYLREAQLIAEAEPLAVRSDNPSKEGKESTLADGQQA